MRSIPYLLFILTMCIQATGWGQTYRAEKESTAITYTMRHPLHVWSGTSKEVNGLMQMDENGKIKSVAIITKVKSFDSENSNRDAHMLEITDALTFPLVSFKSNEIITTGMEQVLARGILSFHGKEKTIDVPCSLKKEGKKWIVKGNFEFMLEDFNITPPSLMLMKTESLVKIGFNASFAEMK